MLSKLLENLKPLTFRIRWDSPTRSPINGIQNFKNAKDALKLNFRNFELKLCLKHA